MVFINLLSEKATLLSYWRITYYILSSVQTANFFGRRCDNQPLIVNPLFLPHVRNIRMPAKLNTFTLLLYIVL